MAEFDLFLSYASADLAVAEELEAWLQAPPRNRTVWRDRRGILPGAPDYYPPILAGISASAAFLLLLSPRWLHSPVAARELSDAKAAGKKLIPVLHPAIPLDPTTPEGRERKGKLMQALQASGLKAPLERPNWIWPLKDESGKPDFGQVEQALATDFMWAARHTVIVQRLNRWKAVQDETALLRGADLVELMADAFADVPGREPVLTIEQRTFLLESQRHDAAERERLRRQRDDAQRNESRALAMLANAEATGGSPTAALRVALAALPESIASPSRAHAVEAEGAALHAFLQLRELNRLDHSASVYSVAFSPNGRAFVTGSEDKSARLWDAATAQPIVAFHGHSDSVTSSAFSPDGRMLATASLDKTARIWDVGSGKEISVLRGHEEAVYSVAFSPDGLVLATGSRDKTVRLWEVSTGRQVACLLGHDGYVASVAFSPDGRTLVTGSWDKTARLWDVKKQQEIGVLSGHGEYLGFVSAVAFGPDGRMVATGSFDKTARLWDVETRKEVATLTGHSGDVRAITFSHDGRLLATGSGDSTIRLWEVVTGKETDALRGHEGRVFSIAFSPDDRKLVSASFDHTSRLWHVASGAEIAILRGHGTYVNSVAFSPDSRTLATGSSDETARLWDVATGREFSTLVHGVWLSAESIVAEVVASSSDDEPDGLHDQIMENLKKAAQVKRNKGAPGIDGMRVDELAAYLKEHWPQEMDDLIKFVQIQSNARVEFLVFSPDGRTLATASGYDAKLWEISTGREAAAFRGHSSLVCSVSFSPDGRTLATGSWDKTARLWEVTTGNEIQSLRGHEDHVNAVAFSPDGRMLATGSEDGTARLWDVAAGKEIVTLHHKDVVAVAFSPDGRMLATGSSVETRLWEVPTGGAVAILDTGGVRSVAFSPDGRMLAIGLFDGTAQLREVARGWEIVTLRGHAGVVFSVAFSPDGRMLATGSCDHTVRLWPVGQGLIDLACARVHGLPLSENDKRRFGIENEWCTPEVSAALRAKMGLDNPAEKHCQSNCSEANDLPRD